jgi:hemoglobin/transferrin/lactoferrin receptor protein
MHSLPSLPCRLKLSHLAVQTVCSASFILSTGLAATATAAPKMQATASSYTMVSGQLQQAIKALAQQAKVSIRLDEGINPALITPAVQNARSVEQALQALISGLGLHVTGNVDTGYVIGISNLPTMNVLATREVKDKTLSAEQFSASASLANIVRYQPLVSAPATASGSGNVWDSNGNAGYNIRGIEGNRIGLEVDGIALPDAAPKPDSTSMNAFAVGREYFDPEMMQEVTIATGAQTAGNGASGLGGKVRFRSKAPQDFLSPQKPTYVAYKFAHDSGNASRLHSLTGAWGSQAIQAMLIAVKRDGEQTKTLGKVAPNPDDWNSQAVLAKLNWNINSTQRLAFTIDRFEQESQRVFSSRINPTYPQGVKQFANTDRQRFSVDYDHTLAMDWIDHLSVRAYTQDAKQKDLSLANYVLSGKTNYRTIETSYLNKLNGLSIDAEKKLSAHAINYGFKLETSSSQRPWREDRLVIATGEHQITNKNRMADMDGQTIAAYVNDRISFDLLGQSSTLTPGVRFEQRKLSPQNLKTYIIGVPAAAKEIQEETSHFVTPSLRLDMQHTPTLSSFAAFSRNTRPVSAAEKTGTYDSFSYTGTGQGYAILGNPKLKNETSDAFELGLNAQPTPGLELQVSGFYNRYQNFIDYVIQAPDLVNYPTISFGLYRPENIGKAATWGAEVSAQFRFEQWSPALRGTTAHFALGAANGTAENSKTGQRDFLPSVAPMKASFGLRYDDPSKLFGAALNGIYVDAKQPPVDVVSGGGVTAPRFAMPSYSLFDVNAYWNIQKNLKLNLAVYNVSNQKYWDYANSRKLAAMKNASDAAAALEIERQVMPGRSVVLSVQLSY